MIPNEQQRNEDIEAIRKKINLPDGWKIGYDVMPFQMSDLNYTVDRENKIVRVIVYSARYPSTLYNHIDMMAREVNTFFELNPDL